MQQRRRLSSPGVATQLRMNPVLAILLAITLITTAAFGGRHILHTQGVGSGPINVTNTSVSLASGDNVVIDDAAIATQGEGDAARTVKEFTRDEPFSMFALTWQGPADISAFVRAERPDGSWSQWYDTEQLNMAGANGVTGTELIYVEPTTRIQVNLSGVELVDDAAIEVPAAEAPATEETGMGGPDLEPVTTGLPDISEDYVNIAPVADVHDERKTAEDLDVIMLDGGEGLASGINPTSNTAGMPKVITRAGWGANEGIRCGSPTYTDPVSAVTVHHTAGSNNYTEAQAPGIVRGIYTYHAQTLGWCDVGYGALVDKYGNIYEGRYGGLDKAVQGAHVGGFNQNTWGISMLGNYETAQPSAAAIQAMGEMAGWKAAVHGFEPKGSSKHYAEFSFTGSRYGKGQGGTFPNINAHRDFHFNTCPGGNLYAQMGRIRDIAQNTYNSIKSKGNVVPPPRTTPAPGGAPSANTSTGPIHQSALPHSADAAGLGAVITAGLGLGAALLDAAIKSGAIELPEGVGSIKDLKIFDNFSIAQLGNILDGVISASSNQEIYSKWKSIESIFGSVLGDSTSSTLYTGMGGPSGDLAMALFDNGIIVDSAELGTHAMWGEIAEAWLKSGLDLGPLGLPTTDQYYTEGDKLRVDFQSGSITFDPATLDLNINTH